MFTDTTTRSGQKKNCNRFKLIIKAMQKSFRIIIFNFLLLLSSVVSSQTRPAVVKVDFNEIVGDMTPI